MGDCGVANGLVMAVETLLMTGFACSARRAIVAREATLSRIDRRM
jgi:hypothetical protein